MVSGPQEWVRFINISEEATDFEFLGLERSFS